LPGSSLKVAARQTFVPNNLLDLTGKTIKIKPDYFQVLSNNLHLHF
jgi:hypothetical protein